MSWECACGQRHDVLASRAETGDVVLEHRHVEDVIPDGVVAVAPVPKPTEKP